ncbi:hypothetical protein MKP08_00980 [Erythrobacter sp. LQ02-29]|uniref:hypothetical protein n=1 Tax=Erythrobacter sp. LQ02-29 TaxID=2920384 RepID=UPI001F4ED955|nr:hypothetical protein [Erythrobacter sp. LQ02-29]MCP9221323.1 hypothetical protein [Erythrobacter sp. LQ02-29]
MSRFQKLIDNLSGTDELLSRLLEQGEDEFTRINSLSVKRRRNELAADLDEYLAIKQRSFLVYRIMRSGEQRYPAKAVGGALEAFQDLLTSIYDALVSGPKKRFRPALESVQETMLEFGGASAGSVKIFLAVDEDRMLIDETKFQRALQLVEKTLSAQNTDDLTDLSKQVGVASISKAFTWAQHASQNGFTTELSWGQSLSERNDITIYREEAERIRALIAERSDEETDLVDEVGVLHGFDKDSSYFHFEVFGQKEHIKGEVSPSMSQRITTGVSYKARMAMTTVTVFATGEEKVKWMLLSLDAPSDGMELGVKGD